MTDPRAQYLADAVATMSPGRLLTLVYDRLLLDLERGTAALRAGDRAGGTTHLRHAQDVVAELVACLDVDVWEGGPGLLSVYTYLLGELVGAESTGDAERVEACRALVEPLAEAWREAAAAVAPSRPAGPPAAPHGPAASQGPAASPAGGSLLGGSLLGVG